MSRILRLRQEAIPLKLSKLENGSNVSDNTMCCRRYPNVTGGNEKMKIYLKKLKNFDLIIRHILLGHWSGRSKSFHSIMISDTLAQCSCWMHTVSLRTLHLTSHCVRHPHTSVLMSY